MKESNKWACFCCGRVNGMCRIACGDCGKRRWEHLGHSMEQARELLAVLYVIEEKEVPSQFVENAIFDHEETREAL